MLVDSKVIEKLAKKDKGLFNKLKQFITDFFNKIVARYKKLTPTSAEARHVQEIKGMSEKLQSLFEDALLDAAENHRIVGTQKNTAQGGVRYQLNGYSETQIKNWSNSKNIVIYQNEQQLERFVSDAIEGKNLQKKIYFGSISKDLAVRIK